MGSWRRRLGPFLLLGLGLGLVLLFGYRAAVMPIGQTALEDGSQEVRESTTVGQTFVVPFDELYRVDLYMSPRGRTNQGDVVFHLRAAPDATDDLRQVVVNASTVKKDDWVRFEFAPIADSGGMTYYLSLESPSSRPGDALAVFRSAQDRYRDGTYYLDGAPADGDLAFRIYSQPGPIAWMQGLGRLLAQDRPSIWGDPALFGALFAGYVILLVLAIKVLVHEESEDELP